MLALQYTLYILLAYLGASCINARVLRPRDCSFTWPAKQGDTCRSLAEEWSITEAEFISFNPGAPCSSLVANTEYCVEWQGDLPVTSQPTPTKTIQSSSTSSRFTLLPPVITWEFPASEWHASTTTTKPPSGPATPTPVQSGASTRC